jgi:osmoprotectant transport system permease protein
MTPNVLNQLRVLPDYLGSHILLSAAALAVAVAVSLPLAVAAARSRHLGAALLAVAGVIETIPGLALLALMVPLLGRIGWLPAALALVLYGMLPILRNTVTGIQAVDPALTEAARGMGMTGYQMLRRIELPLAAPVLIAGVRTASVWIVGMATLATPVGATSLGNYIFSGLQTQNNAAVIIGCLAAAGLAIILDLIIRLLEVSASRRSYVLGVVSGIALASVVLAGGFMTSGARESSTRRPVIIGAKTFTEQYILARFLQQDLRDHEIVSRRKEGMGSVILLDALTHNSLDCCVDYSGTIWANSMGRTGNLGRQTVVDSVSSWLLRTRGIVCLGSLGFENRYALAMRRSLAERLNISSVADLAPVSGSLTIGGDYEFFARPEWTALVSTYALDFSADRRRTFDPTLMYSAIAQDQVDVISAYSTDGRIAAYDLVVLDDPRHALPPYDALLLLSPHASENADLVKALTPLIGRISDDNMRTANMLVDVRRQSLDSAAAYLQSVVNR